MNPLQTPQLPQVSSSRMVSRNPGRLQNSQVWNIPQQANTIQASPQLTNGPKPAYSAAGMFGSQPVRPVGQGMLSSTVQNQLLNNYNPSTAQNIAAPTAPTFDPNDPNNAALAGYMAAK